jgi:AcrR family transcriptional regulator
VENDARILSAALATIDHVGVDRLTTVGVAKAAGLTTGAMYARYEHQNELLVDVWQQRSQSEVRELVCAAVEVRRSRGDAAALDRLVGLMREPSAALRVGTQLMVVTRRIDELADVVPADVRSMLEDAGIPADQPCGEHIAQLGLVCVALGAVFLASIPGTPEVDWSPIAKYFAADGPPSPQQWAPAPAYTGALAREPDDPVLDALLHSGQQVIARSGVERATLTRIGRAARLSPTVVYTRYDNREALIVDIIRLIYRTIITPELRTMLYSSPEMMALGLSTWASTQGEARRRLTMEVVLASAHHPRLAEIAVETDDRARQGAADLLAERYGSREIAADILFFGTAGADGVAMLLDVGVDLVGVDWQPFTALVVGGAMADA